MNIDNRCHFYISYPFFPIKSLLFLSFSSFTVNKKYPTLKVTKYWELSIIFRLRLFYERRNKSENYLGNYIFYGLSHIPPMSTAGGVQESSHWPFSLTWPSSQQRPFKLCPGGHSQIPELSIFGGVQESWHWPFS